MKWSTFIAITTVILLLLGVSAGVKFFRGIDYSGLSELDEKSGMRWAESLSRDYSTTERYEKSGNLSDHPLMHGGWKYRWSKEGQKSWGANSAYIAGDNQDLIVIQVARQGYHVETNNPANIVNEIAIDVKRKTFISKTFFVERLSKRMLGLLTDERRIIPEKYVPMNRYHGTFTEQDDGTFLFKYYFVSNHEAGRKKPNDPFGEFTLTRVNKKLQYAWVSTSHPIEPLGID